MLLQERDWKHPWCILGECRGWIGRGQRFASAVPAVGLQAAGSSEPSAVEAQQKHHLQPLLLLCLGSAG